MLITCVRYLHALSSLNYRSSDFRRRISPDIMGFSVSENHARIDRRSPPPEPDSNVSDKSLPTDRDPGSNPIAFQTGINESVQNTYNLNPNLDGDGDSNSECGETSTTPLIAFLSKENAAFLAAEYTRLKSSCEIDTRGKALSKERLEIFNLMNQEKSDIILKMFHDMNHEGDNKDDEKLLALVNQIKDLRIKVKDRKKWATEKELQAANKRCNDIIELMILRNEREKNKQIAKNKTVVEDDPKFMSLVEVEIALRRACAQVDRAHLLVRSLHIENMEIRADIAACKLDTHESVKKWFEAAKREKNHLKKVSGWEKQIAKLQEFVTSEKQKLVELQEEMVEVEAAKKTKEAKWREEQEAKERALARVKQERGLKEETVSNNKQIHDSLRARNDLDFKRHKDDIQRLEQELTRVKSWTNPDQDLTSLFGSLFEDDTIGKLLHGTGDDDEEDDKIVIDRECVICLNDEVSVVFLPCAHQVVCGGCDEDMRNKGEVKCVICEVEIEERIHVFGSKK